MLMLQYFQFNIYHNYSHKVGRTTVQLLYLQLCEIRQLCGDFMKVWPILKVAMAMLIQIILGQ